MSEIKNVHIEVTHEDDRTHVFDLEPRGEEKVTVEYGWRADPIETHLSDTHRTWEPGQAIGHISAVGPMRSPGVTEKRASNVERFPVVTICGSMRYFARMLIVAGELTQRGYIVLMPFAVMEEESEVKAMADRMHFAKIERSDEVIVVGRHRGESTLRQINHAKQLGIPVEYVS